MINLDGVWRSDSNWVVPAENSKNTIKKLSFFDNDKVLGVENNGHAAGTRVHEEIPIKNHSGQCWTRINDDNDSKKFVLLHCGSTNYLCAAADAPNKVIIDGMCN